MNHSDDPLLRATADGDPACPDGRNLVVLGRLVRGASALPRPVDLVPAVMSRLADAATADPLATAGHADAVLSDQAIDDLYNGSGTAGDPTLEAFADLIRGASDLEQPVDLSHRVERRLSGSSRQSAVQSLDVNSRWRIWSAVVAGHVAALIALAVYQLGYSHSDDDTLVADETTTPAYIIDDNHANDLAISAVGSGVPASHEPGAADNPALPGQLPGSWSEIRNGDGDLFLMRRSSALRIEARRRYGMEASSAAVGQGLAWLQAQQDPAAGTFGTLTGDLDRDLAVQSLAVLALLGEGLGDDQRIAAARRGLDWLHGRQAENGGFPVRDQVSAGLACLALVEGGLLLDDAGLRAAAEAALAVLDGGAPLQPGVAGLGGFTLLALETAHQGGLRVPAHTLEQARRNLGRSLPSLSDDAGRLGLAAFARFIYGHGASLSTAQQISRLERLPPITDHAGKVNPLGWFFATLALREAGGDAWIEWSQSLQANLLACFTTANGQSWVTADKVPFAEVVRSGGEVFATSLVLLNLQTPYRYLPLARL